MRIKNLYSSHAVLKALEPFSILVEGSSCPPVGFLLREKDQKKTEAQVQAIAEGSFSLRFEAPEPSFDVYALIIENGPENLQLEDLRFGEVFLFAGQSNLSLPLSFVEKREAYLGQANGPIAILDISDSFVQQNGEIFRPASPLSELPPSLHWQMLTGENAGHFSAIAVMFAILLAKKKRAPIGLILTAVGGISIDSYLSRECVENAPEVKDYLVETQKYLPVTAPYNVYGGANYTQMDGIYNEKIAPLKGLSLNAVVWYQGENSCFDFASGRYFSHALSSLIGSYREYFNNAHLPFFVFGITDEFYPYGDAHGFLYIEEALSLLSASFTSVIPLYDLRPRWHNKDDALIYHPIHTIVKEEVAIRLLSAYLFYEKNGRPFVYPKFSQEERQGKILRLTLQGEGRFAKGTSFQGFTLAGKNKVFYPAQAFVSEDKEILLSAPEVEEPLYATYGFTHYPYLYPCQSEEGYPLWPFRSVIEDYSASRYLANQAVLSCDFIKLEENNFGYEAGGGQQIALWEKGELIKNPKTRLSLDKKDRFEGLASLRLRGEGVHDSYFYFSLRGLLSPSGMEQDLAFFPFLTLEVKAIPEVEFHGALFRVNGRILKFSPFDGKKDVPFVMIPSEWRKVALDLRQFYDGSEASYPTKSEMLRALTSLEFYFRGKNRYQVHLDDLRRATAFDGFENEEEKKKEEEAALRLPPTPR